jgi:Holliday junction resolvase-like predicted endonuclease
MADTRRLRAAFEDEMDAVVGKWRQKLENAVTSWMAKSAQWSEGASRCDQSCG